MRYLITGGAGFIGSALANRLIEAGHDVRVVDDVSAGEPSRLHKDISFTRGDVNDIPKMWSLLQGVECVYHLAARVSVPESVLYPGDYNAANVRVFEQKWDGTALGPGQPRTLRAAWDTRAASAGAYVVRVGIFAPGAGWGVLYPWNNDAARFAIE